MMNMNELPKGWVLKKMGEVCQVRNGYAFKSSDYQHTGILLFRQTNLDGEKVNLKNSVFLPENYIEQYKEYLIKKGDILIGMSGSIGKLCVYDLDYHALQNQRTGLLKFSDLVARKYVRFYFEGLEREFKEKSKGVAVLNISAKDIHDSIIPLPPLPEQHLIVAKIEALFSQLDDGVAQLKKAQEQLKVYRQAVLKWAFEGRLTNANVKEGELPEGWKWVKVSQIGKIETGSTPSKQNPEFYSDEFPFYKPTDLEAGYNVYTASDNLSKKGIEQARYLPQNSILITCIGATIGKTGIIRKAGASNQQINAIIPAKDFDPNFIYYQATSLRFQKEIKDNASATTLPILNKSKFQALEMVACSLPEQHRIVREIESRLSVCDKLEETIAQALQQSEALRQSILKRAFEGRLTYK